jgi:hypothetical protein
LACLTIGACVLAQAACTPKELKELVTELGITTHALPDQLALSPADEAELKAVRTKRRVVDIIKQVGLCSVLCRSAQGKDGSRN